MDITVIALALVLFLVVFAIIQYNKLIRLNIQVDEGFSQIEVQLKRRADLIPNLVETVKGYATQEREVFERVVQARAASTTASTLPAVAAADGALTNALRGLLAVAEAYPDLKSSTNFLQLQEELATTENKVSFARHPDMKALVKKAFATHDPKLVAYQWIPREENSHADSILNDVLDSQI